MASKKKFCKSKFISEDLNENLESEFKEDPPFKANGFKRIRNETSEENIISKSGPVLKKKKIESHYEATQYFLDIVNQQLTNRKKSDDDFIKNITNILSTLEADDRVMSENEQKLEQFMGALMKYFEQSKLARKQNITTLKNDRTTYKTELDKLHLEEKTEILKGTEQLKDEFKKLEEKLIADAKRRTSELMRKTVNEAMKTTF